MEEEGGGGGGKKKKNTVKVAKRVMAGLFGIALNGLCRIGVAMSKFNSFITISQYF